MSLKVKIPPEMLAVVAGQVTGLDDESEKGWTLAENTAEAREAFGVEVGQTAFFVVGPEGRLLFQETGEFHMYRIARIGEVLGIEFDPGGKDDDEDDEDDEDDGE